MGALADDFKDPAEEREEAEDAEETQPAKTPSPAVSDPEVVERRRETRSRRDRELAELREKVSGFESMRQSFEQSQRDLQELRERQARADGERAERERRAAEAAGPDPEALGMKADEALAEGKYADWKRLTEQANEIRMRRVAADVEQRMRQEFERSRQQQPDPFVQSLIYRHENVAAAGSRGLAAVEAEMNALRLYHGMQPGPDLLRAAFQAAEKKLAGPTRTPTEKRPTYDRGAAGALAGYSPGAATSEQSGGGGGDGAKLSDLEAAAAKAAGMTPEEYIAYKTDPRAAARKFGRKRA
jgi:hypothetical protein